MATTSGKFYKHFQAKNDANRKACMEGKFEDIRTSREKIKATYLNTTKNLTVPSRDPVPVPAIISKSEFERLKTQAQVVTFKDKLAMQEASEQAKKELICASELRKEQLRKAKVEQTAKLGSNLNKVENEAKKRNLYLLERSFELLQEQDDRVKVANGLILATKCRAIRNAQIAEKELIKKQLDEEEKRLDLMMEQQRQKALQTRKKQKENEESKNKRYVTKLMDQIKENEIQRIIEAERLEEESRQINKALIAIQKQEQKKLEEKRELQKHMREELHKTNAEIEEYKLLQQEEERIAELRVQEFMRKKAEREEAREMEIVAVKAAKELEIARLRAQQEKAQDAQAAMDEMNALRVQEEVEKAWREKEKLTAKKKKEEEELLKIERAKQVDDIRKAQAIALKIEEQDFYKVVQVQNDLYQKEQEKKREKKENSLKHRNELLRQVNDKEKERIKQQQMKFEEGKLQVSEKQINDGQIVDYIHKKVNKLRDNNLPEHYISDIEMQLKLKKLY